MDAALPLWALLGAAAALLGVLPGVHPNGVAALALAAPGAREAWAPALLAASAGYLFGALVAMAFHGSSDADAVDAGPAGREGAELACLAAFAGVLAALPVAVAARYAFGEPLALFAHVHRHRGWLVLALLALAALRERPRPAGPAKALVVAATCGLLGLVAFDLGAGGPFGVPASPLLPLLAGLFAVPGILAAAHDPGKMPTTPAVPRTGEVARAGALGALAGSVLGLLPGLTAGHAATLARTLRAPRDADEARMVHGAAAGAGLVMTAVVALALGPARSGSLMAAVALEPAASWRGAVPSPEAVRWLEAVVVGAGAGCLAALWAAPRVARLWRRLPRRALAGALLAVLTALVLAMNGALGLAVLVAATLAGHLAPAMGVSRVHAMGVILVPVAWRAVGG